MRTIILMRRRSRRMILRNSQDPKSFELNIWHSVVIKPTNLEWLIRPVQLGIGFLKESNISSKFVIAFQTYHRAFLNKPPFRFRQLRSTHGTIFTPLRKLFSAKSEPHSFTKSVHSRDWIPKVGIGSQKVGIGSLTAWDISPTCDNIANKEPCT